MKLVSGAYAAGDLLPSISELKEECGVIMSVIREALKVQSGKGLKVLKHNYYLTNLVLVSD